MVTTDITHEEKVNAIKQHRLEILKTAYEFEKWIQENGGGGTYNEFCDGFGYCYKDRRAMYDGVQDIRSKLQEISARNLKSNNQSSRGE